MDQAANERTDAIIAALLAMLRLMADGFTAAFGAPAAMLKSRPYGEPRQRILRWLNDMECVARRLLLLRTTRFAPRPPEPTPEPRYDNSGPAFAPREAADAFSGPNDAPETWRVDLRIDPPRDPVFAFETPARPRAAPRRARPVLIYADCPRPLALRFEAILRVLDDPDGYAARLAHRLHRWRCRPAWRQDFLRRLSRPAQIVNEAGLAESHWDSFAGARTLMLEMAPVLAIPKPAEASQLSLDLRRGDLPVAAAPAFAQAQQARQNLPRADMQPKVYRFLTSICIHIIC